MLPHKQTNLGQALDLTDTIHHISPHLHTAMSSSPPVCVGTEPPRLTTGQLWLWLGFLMTLVLMQLLYVAQYAHVQTQPPTHTMITYRV